MAIVTFWNDNTGKIGQTHSAIAIATYIAKEHNYKVLLMSTRYNDQVVMQAFGEDQRKDMVKLIASNKNSMDLESGIEGMAKMAAANRLTPEMVSNYTNIIFKQKLEIIAGPKEKEDINYERIYSSCKDILNVAKKYYDIIFVDLNNGFSEKSTREILNISNIIILNIEQKLSELKTIVELREKEKIFSPKNTLLLINRYDRNSKYSTKNITRELNEKKEILSVPYNNLFLEAVQEGVTAEFFLNPRINRLEDTEDKTAFFINELKRACQAIIYMLQELQMRI